MQGHSSDHHCMCEMEKTNAGRSPVIFRWLMTTLIVLMSCFLVLLAVMPKIASTDWAKSKLIIPLIDSRINGTVSIQHLKLSWFGEQKIQGLELKDHTGSSILRLETLTTDTSLWNLLYIEPRLGKIHVTGMDVVLEQEETGLTNFHRTLLKRHSKEKASDIKERIILSNLNARFVLPSVQTPLIIDFDGKTEHNDTHGHFEVEAIVQGISFPSLWQLSSFSTFGLKITDKPDIQIKANIENFPVDVLDRLIALKHPKARGMITDLIGKNLNLSLVQVTEQEGLAFHLKVQSSKVEGDVRGIANAAEFYLTQPGKISLQISPQILRVFKPQNSLKSNVQNSEQVATAELILRDFHLPVFSLEENQPASSSAFSMKADITLDHLELTKESFFRKLKGSLITKESSSREQGLFLSISGEAVHEKEMGQFNLKGEFSLAHLSSEKQPLAMKMEMEGYEIPTLFFDHFLSSPLLITEAIGSKVSLQVKMMSHGEDSKATVQLSSEKLTLPAMEFKLEERIYLSESTTINYRFSPELFSYLFPDQNIILIPQAEIPFVLTLHQLSFPSPFYSQQEESFFQPEKTIINAELTSSNAIDISLPQLDLLTLNHLRLQIHGQSLANVQCILAGDLEHAHISTQFTKAFGSQSHLHLQSRLTFAENGNMEVRDIKANLNTNQAILHFVGGIENQQSPVFKGHGWFSYQLTPLILKEIGLTHPQLPTLSGPANMKLIVDSLTFPLSNQMLKQVMMGGKLEIDQLTVQEKEGIPLASLHEITIPWMIDTAQQQIHMNLLAKTRHQEINTEGTLQAHVSLSGWSFEDQFDIRNLKIKGQAELDHLPIAVVETLTAKENLTALFGSSLMANIDADINLQSQNGGVLELSLQGTQFQLNGGLKVNQAISLKDIQPLSLKWTLTPERFAILRQLLKSSEPENSLPGDLILNSPAEISLEITDLHIPWLATLPQKDIWILEKHFGLLKAQIDGKVSVDKLSLSDTVAGHTTIFRQFSAALSSKEIARAINLNVYAKGHNIEYAEQTEISLASMIEHGFSSEGKFNLQGTSITLDARAKHAPIVLLCNFVCLGNQMLHQVDAILGNELDAEIHARLQNLNGLVQVNFKGTNGQLNLDGIVQNGFLTLNKPLRAETLVTPKLSKSVLQEFMPLLSSAIGAEKAVAIEIDPKGFVLPIKTWDINQVAIDKISIDLGKVYFSNEGQIGQILSILNFRQTQSNEPLAVWFTPLYANMHNGGVNVERMDMLAVNLYPVAIWGLVDFVNDKVNMKIGLSKLALKNAFGVTGLPEDYLLQLSLKGKTDDARIDKAKATAKISSLVAQSHGPQGVLIGGILDLVGGNYKEKQPPSPTTYPFPWETAGMTQEQVEAKPTQETKDSKIVTPLVPMKAIEKGASEIIKMFR